MELLPAQAAVPPASKWLRRAMRVRYVLLGLYLLLTLAWYYAFMAATSSGGGGLTYGQYAVLTLRNFLIATLILLGVQGLLLLGAPQLHWPRPRRRRSIFVSLAIGSAIALLLSLGIHLAMNSLYRLIQDPASFHVNVSVGSPNPAPATAPSPPSASEFPWLEIGILFVGWAFWFLVFALVGAAEWRRRFAGMYRALVAGTILELLITIPIDAQVRKRTNCYCGEGTLLSLIIGLTAILWTFGPGVAILFLIRRNQLASMAGRCLKCDYDLRGLESSRCPECGTPFNRVMQAGASN
ncbi:MAG TPA: hypothetical protein VFW23_06320 [Tepidisphaeraceae bacterium]|nr:hypothetical protein [Tepidisphaeraceae bacterium]